MLRMTCIPAKHLLEFSIRCDDEEKTYETTNKSRVRGQKNSIWTTIHGECMFRTKRNRQHEEQTRPTINQRTQQMEWYTQSTVHHTLWCMLMCACALVWVSGCSLRQEEPTRHRNGRLCESWSSANVSQNKNEHGLVGRRLILKNACTTVS